MRQLFAIYLAIATANLGHAQSAIGDWDAIVSYCAGDNSVTRDGQAYRLQRGAGIRYGDTIELATSGQISVTFFSGLHYTLAGPARVRLRSDLSQCELQIDYGEIRVVHNGERPLSVRTPEVVYALGRTIFRLKKTAQQTTAQLEAGMAAMVASEGLQPLNQYTAVATSIEGRSEPESGVVGWSIDASQVRLAAAMQATPQLRLPNAASPQLGAPAPQAVLQDPASPLATSPAQPTPSKPSLEQQPPLPEDDDELPRFAQTPEAATRGGEAADVDSLGLGLPSFSGSSSLSLGSFSGSSGLFSSGGLFADAGQQTFQGKVTPGSSFPTDSPFPGSIHLVTAEQKYAFDSVTLDATEQAAVGGGKYFSVATGGLPIGQVVTDAATGTSPTPITMSVTRFDAQLIQLDQYGVPDPANDGAGLASNIGITGLAGPTPAGPAVVGAAALVDERASFNGNATFALGEFRVSVDGSGTPTFAIRRSDQDRLIVKDLNGNDAEDLVTPNGAVTFDNSIDPRFLPQSPSVKTPSANGALDKRGTSYSELNFLRRSAFTNVVANTLQDYSRRTGQTRFVVDGKIVDISGYQPGQ